MRQDMNGLYYKNQLKFALTWIISYVVGTSATEELSRLVGIEKIITVPFLIAISVVAVVWRSKNNLFEEFGLCKSDISAKRFIYYVPLIVLVSCNFWLGVKKNGTWVEFALYALSMLCVGFLEELIFRGFLFNAMAKDGIRSAVIVSSVTFGIGHIVNLFNGSGATLLPNLCQIVSAIAIGFLFVVMFYRGKSLIPCILAHQFINVTSFFANEEALDDTVRIVQCIVICIIALLYAGVLLKTLPKREN
jgi:membrane protease YdiL (CAAX protease family)